MQVNECKKKKFNVTITERNGYNSKLYNVVRLDQNRNK